MLRLCLVDELPSLVRARLGFALVLVPGLTLTACGDDASFGVSSGELSEAGTEQSGTESMEGAESGSESGSETGATGEATETESGEESGETEGGTGNTTGLPGGGGVGDPCDASMPCRDGLECGAADTCEPSGSTPSGGACLIADECADGMQCVGGFCTPSGGGDQGDGCQSDADCATGFKCGLVGFGAQCVPAGTGDVGQDCATAADCFGGLTCIDDVCTPVPPGLPPFGGLPWAGVDCDPVTSPEVRAFFEVPGATSPAGQDGDFFRLPFPNDIMMSGGRVDYGDFPRPGDALLGYDPVQRYIDALEANNDAWGGQPVVLFRFSGRIDLDTFASSTGVDPVRIKDITPGDPAFGTGGNFNYLYSLGRSKYVCENWMAVKRGAARPLVPGHTYAYFLTTDGKANDGGDIERSEHLIAMLSDTVPSDSALASAHAAYQPFRDYLASESISPDTILNASVVTAGQVRTPMEDLAALANAAPVASATSWVKCGGATPSPCPDAADERACGNGTAEYDEYHALVTLPSFQEGTLPFEQSGGAIASASTGSEQVCLSLTVPTAVMPLTGWPTVVYAHGTNGNFRSHVRDDVAGALANAGLPAGGTVNFAVLGIDQAAHGTRRGGSTQTSQDIFFNVANPDAAQGYPMQAAADQLALARFAAALDIDAATSGGDPILVDPNALVFFGHSQGALAGSLATPFTDLFQAVVLSGHGGSITHSVLEKRNPVDIAGALPFALQDFDSMGELPMGDNHPALGLLQHWVDPSDPYTMARAMVLEPPAGTQPQNVFMTYGQGDTYSPNTTGKRYAQAARLDEVTADASVSTPDDLSLTQTSSPLVDNETIDGTTVTSGIRQYSPATGEDGHFVTFDIANANGDAVRFMAMAAAGLSPAIGQ